MKHSILHEKYSIRLIEARLSKVDLNDNLKSKSVFCWGDLFLRLKMQPYKDGSYKLDQSRKEMFYKFGNVCMYVCMFAIGARTFGARGLKFGPELGFHPESFFG